ncbi:hypothetical protein SDRG_11896 [Saprolegnia diclina VS20]|uniref:Uncharacterized protein n=1 Tax=Saprolegnia diclina (strain VS20) TaxID=1156394 RepID=T0PXP5_SAPDV|nr:hypothetical protein SDRG_11896 [Saprolegnia diclina VS20]EQC30319.1 hypothetical protein SDRG_11896 [Saprolegnia diclina VS20]|eukprot:XP_008616172.1 hypothetical protein SDRG_11896 [Saprolegnia diclina VS20]
MPGETLPLELAALRDLGAAVDLADHWPVVHVTKIPIQHVQLAVAALPTFAGIYIDAGFMALAWLDATLPPTIPLTLVLDPSESGVPGAIAYNWGDRISEVIVKGHAVDPDPVPEFLSRCVNVQCVTIEDAATPLVAAACLAALPTNHLHALRVHVVSPGALDAAAIVAWLHGPCAVCFSLSCETVLDPTALAIAIASCESLSSLSFENAMDVQDALATSEYKLDHILSLSLGLTSGPYVNVLAILHPSVVARITLAKTQGEALVLPYIVDALGECTMLEEVSLVNAHISPMSTTRKMGHCVWLTSVAIKWSTFAALCDVPKLIQWFSTSRQLASVDLTGTALGKAGVVELARALPAWMARGLQSLNLEAMGLKDDDVVVLAVALASSRNCRRLAINLAGNQLTNASVPLLLTTLGACRDVILHLSGLFVDTGRASNAHDRRDSYANERQAIRDLMKLHQLQYIASSTFASPSRTSSPWHPICL